MWRGTATEEYFKLNTSAIDRVALGASVKQADADNGLKRVKGERRDLEMERGEMNLKRKAERGLTKLKREY